MQITEKYVKPIEKLAVSPSLKHMNKRKDNKKCEHQQSVRKQLTRVSLSVDERGEPYPHEVVVCGLDEHVEGRQLLARVTVARSRTGIGRRGSFTAQIVIIVMAVVQVDGVDVGGEARHSEGAALRSLEGRADVLRAVLRSVQIGGRGGGVQRGGAQVALDGVGVTWRSLGPVTSSDSFCPGVVQGRRFLITGIERGSCRMSNT